MQLYHYHPKTMEFTRESEARLDPKELANGIEKPLVPKFATLNAPPATGLNEVAICDGVDWEVVPDYRGQYIYNKDNGSPLLVDDTGEINDDYVTIKPLISFPKWDEPTSEWVVDTDARDQYRILEIKSELVVIDEKSIRATRAILKSGNGTADDIQYLDDLEAQAVLLRAELDGLE